MTGIEQKIMEMSSDVGALKAQMELVLKIGVPMILLMLGTFTTSVWSVVLFKKKNGNGVKNG